ncbi:hypothetical protein [Sphingobium sp. WCS2017Hpa-17]|uniref:hypothetical protein n=1 Tax=Sphingobium sp. WCS2017Hpa-17 TaxID=3073638 RepID=UPI00288925E8|nr:hypothetical protein [Sphingobium sp. WCS2017Hpa-17]
MMEEAKQMDAAADADWAISLNGLQGPDQLGRVWIAQPLAVGDDRLVFSGHVANAGNGVAVTIRHGSDVLASCIAAPGFVVDVPARKGVFHVCMTVRQEQGRDVICRWEVADQERQRLSLTGMVKRGGPSPDIPATGAQTLLGRMGQLFLSHDTNDSVAQFTRPGALGDVSVRSWTDLFSRFPGWKSDFGLHRISLLVAPAKEEILRDYYPFPRASGTMFDDFLKRFKDEPVIMPRWELWNARTLSFAETDTHWTDFGAMVAAQTVLKRWELPIDGMPQAFTVKQKIGDLGLKLHPPSSNFELCFNEKMSDRLVFDNGIHNHGCVRIYRNPVAPIGGKLLIFGDSFGTNLAEAMSYAFREVVYTYQPAGVDPELVAMLAPTHMLLQITQRFIHGAPATNHSIFEQGRSKLARMGEAERTKTLAHLAATPEAFRSLAAPLLQSH